MSSLIQPQVVAAFGTVRDDRRKQQAVAQAELRQAESHDAGRKVLPWLVLLVFAPLLLWRLR